MVEHISHRESVFTLGPYKQKQVHTVAHYTSYVSTKLNLTLWKFAHASHKIHQNVLFSGVLLQPGGGVVTCTVAHSAIDPFNSAA